MCKGFSSSLHSSSTVVMSRWRCDIVQGERLEGKRGHFRENVLTSLQQLRHLSADLNKGRSVQPPEGPVINPVPGRQMPRIWSLMLSELPYQIPSEQQHHV